MNDSYMQFMNEFEVYGLKNDQMQKEKRVLFFLLQKLAPKSRFLSSVYMLKISLGSYIN